jgi:hypothetical protein
MESAFIPEIIEKAIKKIDIHEEAISKIEWDKNLIVEL